MFGVNQLTVNFGERFLFNQVSFIINKQDRVGLTGRNGAGKSTMLKIFHGSYPPSAGNVSYPNDCKIGYLPQDMDFEGGKTVLEDVRTAFAEVQKIEDRIEEITTEISEREDYESDSYTELLNDLHHLNERLMLLDAQNMDAKIEKILLGLGFEKKDFLKLTDEFSGGWRMRIELAKVLLEHSDLLLLDEPTNHLDIESIQWLEEFLKTYNGAVVLISHDKAFLDNVTKRTIEISLGKIYDYPANYSKYLIMRQERREQQMAAYTNQQKQIKDTEQFIERFRYKATKSNQVQSRIKQLAKIDMIEIDEEDTARMTIKFPPAPRSGKVVVEAKDVEKCYDDLQVFSDVSLYIERGERVAFVGKNGEGKSTLTRLVVGKEKATSGYLKTGHNVELGYYAQNQAEELNPEKTVFETIDDEAKDEMRTQVRKLLGAFMFSGEDVDKKVKVLSGGERARVAFCKLLLNPVNLLVLDEPTNHLDIQSKEVLKNALNKYDGTLIVISHDRDFLKGLTQKVFEFKSHKVKEFPGDIDAFLANRKVQNFREFENNAINKKDKNKQNEKSENKVSYQERKELNKEISRLKSKTERLENEISTLETALSELNKKMLDPETFSQDLITELAAKNRQLEQKMQEWENLTAELEKKS